MKITFCGAAGEVTGSQHLLQCGELRILLDCGLFQGRRGETRRKNERFQYPPETLDAVILSHAHIDHCGNLPSLYKAGFRGPVYCTDATADIANIMLQDSVRIQAEDAAYMNRHLPPGQHITPLYDEEHVRGIVKQFEPVRYNAWNNREVGLRFRFRDAGHVLGSAITEMEFAERGSQIRVVFTGDLGRRDLPLLRDPDLVSGCDVLITECTYGNRVHTPADDIKTQLQRIITEAAAKRGKVIIPAFSLGRTQQIVYFLNELANANAIPRMPVYVDSPLSMRVTDVFRQHAEDVLDEELQRTLLTDTDAFAFGGLTYVATPQESMRLNRQEGPMVIIAASGMCESGRVLHHLKHAVAHEENTVIIIGFQAEHTLGRRIVERRPFLRILGAEYPLRANVEILNGLSAHADVHDFKWWFSHMAQTTGIGQAFLVHGEPAAAQALAQVMRDYCDEEPVIPKLYETVEIQS